MMVFPLGDTTVSKNERESGSVRFVSKRSTYHEKTDSVLSTRPYEDRTLPIVD